MRFFFHVYNGKLFRDEIGHDFASIADARSAAVRAAGEDLKDIDGRFWKTRIWKMYVTTEAGELAFALSFSAEEETGQGPFWAEISSR